MNRIAARFRQLRSAGEGGVVPFVMAGDPDPASTIDILRALDRAGSACIELGVPFSDPVADGPVIQRAAQRALRHGIGLNEILEMVRAFRKTSETPVVLFSYLNPLLRFGIERLADAAHAAGVDGVLVTDLPAEEADEFAATMAARELACIFLVAPTSTDARLARVAQLATTAAPGGFIYAVSRTGVTGTERAHGEAQQLVARVRALCDVPVAVGFGVSTPEHVRDICRYADAAVVGSALVKEIEAAPDPQAAARRAEEYLRELHAACGLRRSVHPRSVVPRGRAGI